MNDENQMWREFAANRSEPAFAALVRLHLNLVFTTALRQVGDRGLAEEITQNVFVALAQKGSSLQWSTTLAGWLYQTTVNQSRLRLRTELRRQRREEIAAGIAKIARDGDSIWASVIPLLDEALLSLHEKDRLAVLLHYLEERPLREVGQALGVGEDAARKRVHRVIDDLVAWFRKRGLGVSTTGLVGALALQNSTAASAALTTAIISTSCAAPFATLSISAILMTSTQFKAAVIGAALLLTLSGSYLAYRGQTKTPPTNSDAPPPAPVVTPSAKATPSASPKPQLAATSPVSELPKNFFARLHAGDETLARLSNAQADAFVIRNRTNAESLLAAYQVTRDFEYLRIAATNFPNDPATALRVVGHDLFPENRRAWLDQFKKADPDNALASYLSANEHLKNNEIKEALADTAEASTKKGFRDYTIEQSQTLEEMYLAAGHSPAEAKALGVSAIEMPFLRKLVETTRNIKDLSARYQDAGDSASAQGMIQLGLGISDRLKSLQDGGNMRLGEFIGWNVEKGLLDRLDPKQTYPFLQGSVESRLEQFDRREKAMRADNDFISDWIANAPDADIIAYFDRLKLYGESAAVDWLKKRGPAPDRL